MALNATDNDTNLHVKIEFETSDDDSFISKIESLNEGCTDEDLVLKEFIKEEPVDYELVIEQPIEYSLPENIETNYVKRADSCNSLNEINLTLNKFPSKQSSKKLTREKNINKYSFECDSCKRKFTTKGYLKTHIYRHCHTKQEGPYICNICDKEFRIKSLLIRHLRSHNGERLFPCNVCGKSFRKSYLYNHMKIHTDVKPCHCNMCDKKFRTKRELTLHMQTHTGKINACYLCDKKYCRKYALNVHMRTHTGERPFSCYLCHKAFINKGNLDQHLKTHMESNSTLAKRKKPRIRRPITKKCVLTEDTKTQLSVDFESSVVQAHTTSGTALYGNIPVRSNQTTAVNEIENNTNCVKQGLIPIEIKTEPVISEEEYVIVKNECLKREEDFVYVKKEFVKVESVVESGWPVNEPIEYNSASDSILSESTETSGFTCDVCKRTFNSRRNLRRHIIIHAEHRSSFICEICKRSCLEKKSLARHMRIHTGERPFACSKCDKKFKQKSDLTKHIKTHTGQKPFSCQMCDKKFTLKYNLQIHARIHTGERPYACDECEKTFRMKSGLTKHKKTHNKEKPFHKEVF